MTVGDPTTFTLQVRLASAEYEKLNALAAKAGFATVAEYLVGHALGQKSTYVPPAAVVSSVPTGSVQMSTDEVETPAATEKKVKG